MTTLDNLTISLTLNCNQGCQHCWVDAGTASAGELDNAEVAEVLAQARGLGAQHVKFTGGEPLVRKGFGDVLAIAYDLGFRISLETNGTGLTRPVVDRLHPFFDRLHLYVSLDGATAEVHDSFRGQPGAFRRTVDNLRILRERDGYFSIHTVTRRQNLAEIPAILDLSRQLGASQLKLILSVHDLGRGRAIQAEAITHDELFALLDALPPQRFWDYRWSPSRSRDTVLMTTLPPAFQPTGTAVTCGWASSYVAVLANGDVAICHGMYDVDEAKAGNVRERPLTELWESSSLLTSLRSWQADDLRGVCGNCAVAESCRGLCRANAIARYQDLRAPYPLCQTLYAAGRFPTEMLRDPTRDATYEPGGRRLLPVLGGGCATS
ncbi:radical SAM additional 4Fe4S-binding SPASM domain-containing protein [Asanoa hainanensis]|uniref:Radical SAM additional 4Fe4S-binding SPASM domain-containing protein n=1 Tax=Asanoa hainanensis TaxID=560556 RepID=A0A239MEK2_9ACTN|nr:radical SAM protein [Asanoa hainanensis]SNT41115.1 radical SAM additional 4Fe4S-binding SPASM domain-containing protein [Asanoa hainanensis]